MISKNGINQDDKKLIPSKDFESVNDYGASDMLEWGERLRIDEMTNDDYDAYIKAVQNIVNTNKCMTFDFFKKYYYHSILEYNTDQGTVFWSLKDPLKWFTGDNDKRLIKWGDLNYGEDLIDGVIEHNFKRLNINFNLINFPKEDIYFDIIVQSNMGYKYNSFKDAYYNVAYKTRMANINETNIGKVLVAKQTCEIRQPITAEGYNDNYLTHYEKSKVSETRNILNFAVIFHTKNKYQSRDLRVESMSGDKYESFTNDKSLESLCKYNFLGGFTMKYKAINYKAEFRITIL